MRKRLYSSVVILFSLASIVAVTFVVAQKTASQRASQRSASQASSRRQTAARQRRTTPQAGPIRAPDPNRAPQNLVDDALFTNEEFFGSQSSVARPYSVAFERVGALLTKYPKDARLHLHAARLSERLGQFDKAASEMSEYAELRGRSPDTLRKLANFYHHRARFPDEVRTLQELAKALTVNERAQIYKRAAELVRTRSLREFKPADFFAELVAADPSNIQPIKDYVEELRLAKQNREALAVLASYRPQLA